MQVVMIGAGRLATQLGLALKEAGHEVTCVYSRTMASAQTLAETLGTSATDSLAQLPVAADVYIVAVKDAALEQVATEATRGREQQLFLHTAGSMPLEVWRGKTVRYGVLYPMQTFSKQRRVSFAEIPVFIEASDGATLKVVWQLAESVSGRVMELTTEQRRHLHLAAVFACNFANHCYALSADILQRQGIPFDVMLPLIDETARKVHTLQPLEAQTGPAVRYDENVIGSQMQLLADRPELQAIYERLSQSIHRLQHTDSTK